jgi:hypothetical protein
MLSDPSCAVRPSSTQKCPASVSSTIRRLWNFRGALITRHSGQSAIRLLFRSPCWCSLQENNSTSAKQTENPHFKSLHIHFNLSPAESVDVPQALDVSQGEHEALSSPELEKADARTAKPENGAEKRGGISQAIQESEEGDRLEFDRSVPRRCFSAVRHRWRRLFVGPRYNSARLAPFNSGAAQTWSK